MKKIKKQDIYVIIGVVVVAIVIIFVAALNKTQAPGSNIFDLLQGPQDQNKLAESDKTPTPKTSGETPITLSYDEAVKLYKDRHFQFGFDTYGACAMSPALTSLKVGTKVMLDNRSSKTLTIGVDEISYVLSPYGFKIITLSTPEKLPHTLNFSCGGGRNNGQIILQ